MLATNQEKQNKLYEEIQSVVPSNGKVKKNHITDLHFMKAVVKESLR